MKLFSYLKTLTKHLEKHPGSWALCGGVVASIYRQSPRFTNDIDIALIDSPELSAQQIAQQVIRELGP